jgi:hypothetical protein
MTNMALHRSSQALTLMHKGRLALVPEGSVDFRDSPVLVLELEAVVAKLTYLNNSLAAHLEAEAEVGLLVLERTHGEMTLKQVLE